MNLKKSLLPLLFVPLLAAGQQESTKKNEVYIDKSGILRLKHDNKEASYFGVNYTLPFAYGYRSHKKLNIDIEKAIDNDVYHLARLGVNAFRVHVWDTEISDSLGNLKNNEHLRLFDYLIAKLEERNIRILVTPIAFWGNGYPDADEKTGSFVEKYTKAGSVVNEQAFLAQERYLDQFFRHVNPYTKKSYIEDPLIIATEINNEPKHSGPKARATEYVNRMVRAVRQTGWTKPVFYNISESPDYADAVAASTADGFSFQWYPTGLVAGHEQQGNLLPLVDKYQIPFDTIPGFQRKPRMVYEFESADVLKPYMYPAMARSFKAAGMQWATQFAYDPMGTAYANTEYQTHYLNLAYTPAKAISLLIAGRIFAAVPAYKDLGQYPTNTRFSGFKLDPDSDAAEMNTAREFYYTSGSVSKPQNAGALEHIAGVGSSEIVKYQGSGAYFLDKVKAGVWRLEVMPDVKKLMDPFGKNELDMPVSSTVWAANDMQILLADLGTNFTVEALNTGNENNVKVNGRTFSITPGTYLVRKKGLSFSPASNAKIGQLGMREFVAPTKAFERKVSIKEPSSTASGNALLVFDGTDSRQNLVVYSPEWATDPYTFGTDNGENVLKLAHKSSGKGQRAGLQVSVNDQVSANATNEYKHIVIKVASTRPTTGKLVLVDRDANAVSMTFKIGAGSETINLDLKDFKADSFMLLPRPYPSFQALYFKKQAHQPLNYKRLDKVQLLLQGDDQENEVRLSAITLLK